jgi:hypothetical protein
MFTTVNQVIFCVRIIFQNLKGLGSDTLGLVSSGYVGKVRSI